MSSAANDVSGGYLSTAQKAGIIRSELKRQYGYTTRDVSVRADVYSMGATLRVKIKSPLVSLTAVRLIAEKFESIRRDDFGEILGGGNTHLDVEYADEVVDAVASKLAEQIPEDGTSAVVGEHVVHRGNSGDEEYYYGDLPNNDDPRRVLRCWGKAHLASQIAIRLLDAGMPSEEST